MAHYYGTLTSNNGSTTRCGHKASGLTVCAASWAGAVSVELHHDSDTDTDVATVRLCKWHGAGVDRVLYTGPVNALEGGA